MLFFSSPPGQVLLRLEHVYQPGDHSANSAPVTIDFSDQIFAAFDVTGLVELGLAGNLPLGEMERLHWNTEKWTSEEHARVHPMNAGTADTSEVVTLQPMEIKSYLMAVTPLQLTD